MAWRAAGNRKVEVAERPSEADVSIGELGIEFSGPPERGDCFVYKEMVCIAQAFLVSTQSFEVGCETGGSLGLGGCFTGYQTFNNPVGYLIDHGENILDVIALDLARE